jgi:hypothetical protein
MGAAMKLLFGAGTLGGVVRKLMLTVLLLLHPELFGEKPAAVVGRGTPETTV